MLKGQAREKVDVRHGPSFREAAADRSTPVEGRILERRRVLCGFFSVREQARQLFGDKGMKAIAGYHVTGCPGLIR